MEISSDEDDFVDNNNPIIKTKISNDEDDFWSTFFVFMPIWTFCFFAVDK